MEHNAVVSENCEKCMRILPANPARMYKVDKSGNILGTRYSCPVYFGISEGVVTSMPGFHACI